MNDLQQRWPLPAAPRPIVIIGAGGIVHDAHLPAYRRLGFEVKGIFDLDRSKAEALAAKFELGKAYETLEEAVAQRGVVYDIAVQAGAVAPLLEALPEGAFVLTQKPLGENLEQAKIIRDSARKRHQHVAVNFQLRFSPNMLAIADAIKRGWLGSLTDVDLRVVINQPWGSWGYLKGLPRVEIVYHSVHYIDLIRSLLGEPKGALALGVGHPELEGFADTRSTIILDYGDRIRCSLVLNHTHRRGPRHQASQFMVEGVKGAAWASMGVNLNYPKGEPDKLELSLEQGAWRELDLRGSWFTEAFEGPMCNLQRVASGEDGALVSGVDDAVKTMAVVEACYLSSAKRGLPIPSLQD